jgi:catechol 2,3-dioxygenase-like lactoylglutathione lyase family enzyme
MGQVRKAGVGQAPARQAALKAGLPNGTSATTINRVCGSGLKSIMLAAAEIRAGDAELVIAGGMESMNQAPYLIPGARFGLRLGNGELVDATVHDGLWCSVEDCHMGTHAERVAISDAVSREDQDAFALSSHQKAIAAIDAGRFDAEMVPVTVRDAKGRETLVATDPEGFEHHIVAHRDDADRRPAIARQTSSLGGLRPRKLGHVNRLTADLDAVTRFHTDVLGMQIADYLGDAGIWFHVNAEHHQMALVRSPFPHFHHLAFDYYDFGTLRSLFDNVAQHGRWLAWGPVRHGIAQNICGYVRITEEPLLVECYVDMEQLEPDHEPRQWPDDRFSSNTWGPLPPRSYFRFDEQAIVSERDSLELLGVPLT